MNIKDQLLQSHHSKANALLVAAYAAGAAKHFAELMQCFLSKDYRLAQRAAWSVSLTARQQPGLIGPHIKSLVAALSKEDVSDAVIRNSVRILQEIVIPKAYHGEVMNACFYFIESIQTSAAIKAFSLTTLYNLSKFYPEIKEELKLIINEKWDIETPAFHSRGAKILKALKAES